MRLLRQHSLTLVTAGLFLTAFACLGTNPVLLGVLPFIFGGVLLSVIDWKVHRLPTKLVYYTLAAVSVGLALASLIEWDWKPALTALLGGVIYGGGMAALWYLAAHIGFQPFGFGDVRLALVLGLLLGWFGLMDVWYGVALGVFLGAALGVVLAIKHRKLHMDMAFGPPLMLATLLVILAHA
jgi:leader peptidase (prepilin peptidase) / N-methyltransferase